MEPILSRCGYRCDLCLVYKPNAQDHPENCQLQSDGWFKYFGFRIPPEEIVCDGCMTPNAELIDQSCPVRPCVIKSELENCSQCAEYPCEKFLERQVIFEDVQSRFGSEISEEDRQRFILPYENKARLSKM